MAGHLPQSRRSPLPQSRRFPPPTLHPIPGPHLHPPDAAILPAPHPHPDGLLHNPGLLPLLSLLRCCKGAASSRSIRCGLRQAPRAAAPASFPSSWHLLSLNGLLLCSTGLHKNAIGDSPILIPKVGLVSAGRSMQSVLRLPPPCLQEFLVIW